MIRFSAMPANSVRDEFIVEASVSQAGNDSALIAVFNSETAAQELTDFLNFLAQLYEKSKAG